MGNLEVLCKSQKEQISFIKETLEVIRNNIFILEKDLETDGYYKSANGAADYERVSDSIIAMKDVAKDLQNELSKIITKKI